MSIETFNKLLSILFLICYSYQVLYLFIPLFKFDSLKVIDDKPNRYAILIAARNEEKVIGNLLDSINSQTYDKKYFDVYVGADNCSDDTALVALNKGAIVFERFNNLKIGKGYVLNFLLRNIKKTGKKYDAYIVFDADNVLDPNYLVEINRVFNEGYEAITSYRNSKNYGDNWLSAGYGLWYLHESAHLNASRMAIGSSCSISGTGFLFSQNLVDKYSGWNFYLLTEDIEFTVENIVNGIKIGYAGKAILYDEQPTNFKQSYYQRLRWSKGYLQVFKKYGYKLFKGMLDGDFSCFDMTMNYAPAAIISVISIVINLGYIITHFLLNKSYGYLFNQLGAMALGMYGMLFLISILTTIMEWNNIYTTWYKKIFYIFTCPIFLITYLPITIIALFKKVSWRPIDHSRKLTLDEIKK